MGRVASITGQARSTLTRENGQPTDSNLAQPSSVILLRARHTDLCPQFSDFRTAAISVSARSHFSNDQFVLPRDCADCSRF